MVKGKQNKDFINCLKALILFEKIKRQQKYGNLSKYDFKLEMIEQKMWIQKMKERTEEKNRENEMEEITRQIIERGQNFKDVIERGQPDKLRS